MAGLFAEVALRTTGPQGPPAGEMPQPATGVRKPSQCEVTKPGLPTLSGRLGGGVTAPALAAVGDPAAAAVAREPRLPRGVARAAEPPSIDGSVVRRTFAVDVRLSPAIILGVGKWRGTCGE
jgi:hypothetical protein